MDGFRNRIPEYRGTRYIIVADEELRDKVIQEINKPQFQDLRAYYFSYSAVNELLSLCQSRKLKGITDDFIETYLDDVFVDINE